MCIRDRIIEDRTEILYPVKDLEVHHGLGFAAWCDNNRVLIGNRLYMEREGVPLSLIHICICLRPPRHPG